QEMLRALDHGRTVGFLDDMDDTFHPQQTRAEVLLQSVEQQAQRFTRDRLLAHEAERRDVAVMQAVVMIVMGVIVVLVRPIMSIVPLIGGWIEPSAHVRLSASPIHPPPDPTAPVVPSPSTSSHNP